uniref:TSA: Wollemia nobilis Ref_Wollemi_Transcript_13311_706 transcribed RNA sequence n=1 Tax=Wollemia nobilis TaxID=56998 RepID=A0A0C9S7K8_9CONI
MAAISSSATMMMTQSVANFSSGAHASHDPVVGRRLSFPHSRAVVPSKGYLHLHVKCMAKAEEEPEASTNSSPPSPPPPQNKVSTRFGDVFAFSGPAPETINGRLAMVGFVSAVGVELASGKDLMSQVSSGEGFSAFVATAMLLSVASLVPMLKGVSAESKSQPIMSAGAEIWNGRLAMVGLLALAVTEYVNGSPLV